MRELVPARNRIPHFAAEELVGDPGVRPLTHAVILIIVSIVAAFAIWAAITPVQEIATGQGEIVPVGAVQAIDHLEGGIIDEIFVKEGQIVDKGQPLLRLSGNIAQSGRDQLTSRLESLSLQAERLSAFAEDRRPNFEAISSDTAMIEDQRHLLDAQILARNQQEEIYQKQMQSQSSQLNAAIQKRESVVAALQLITSKLNIRQELVSKGLNSTLQLIDAQREHAGIMADLRELEGTIAALNSSVAETKSRIVEIRGRLRQEALDKLGTVTADLGEVRKQIVGQEDRVTRLMVNSPVHGIVQELPVKTMGGVTQPGAMVAKVVPIEDELVADIQILPRDIGFVHAGQAVKVKVMAFDYARYGRVEGVLERISPTTFYDRERNPYYLARVRLASNHVGQNAQAHLIVPGMTVQADVATGEKTVLQYLLKPIYTTIESTFGER